MAQICLTSGTFLLISWFFFKIGGKIKKSLRGAPPGPRVGAEAGESSEATNGGRRGALRTRRTPDRVFYFTTHRESQDAQQKVPRYTGKSMLLSKITINMITTFISTFFFYITTTNINFHLIISCSVPRKRVFDMLWDILDKSLL